MEGKNFALRDVVFHLVFVSAMGRAGDEFSSLLLSVSTYSEFEFIVITDSIELFPSLCPRVFLPSLLLCLPVCLPVSPRFHALSVLQQYASHPT